VKKLKKSKKVNYICKSCGKEVTIGLRSYDGRDLCKTCKTKQTNIEKYGVETLLCKKEIREKALNGTGKTNISQLDNVKRKKAKKFSLKTEDEKAEIYQKAKDTMKDRYGGSYTATKEYKEKIFDKFGVENIFQLEEIKDKVKNTNTKKYGVEYPMQNEEILNKAKSTMIEKHGYDNPLKVEEFKNKIKETNLERYGVEYPLQNEFVKNKVKKKIKDRMVPLIHERLKEKDIEILDDYDIQRKGENIEYSFICKKCNSEFKSHLHSHIPLCPVCNPKYSSVGEMEIADFIRSLNLEIITNDRTILKGKELDIFISEKNIAIEYNGLYWHSELSGGKEKDYHEKKTQKCREKGIDLIHVFSDEWIFKKDIVKSILLNKLGLNEKRIYARKCIVKEIKSSDAIIFYNLNHIQGGINSSVNLGLFFENEMISVMSFSKSRFEKDTTELTRFASKKGCSVVGGFGKLFKHYINNYKFNEITTYADIRFFDGNVYERNGFKFSHQSQPNYYYLDSDYNYRYSRIKFQKYKLADLLENFDEDKTEWENMIKNGFDRIWDCGNLKFNFKKNG
jgi:hypothetical protein